MKVWHLVELEENPNIACIKWQQMFLGIVDYRAPCKRRRVGNVAAPTPPPPPPRLPQTYRS